MAIQVKYTKAIKTPTGSVSESYRSAFAITIAIGHRHGCRVNCELKRGWNHYIRESDVPAIATSLAPPV